MKKLVSGLAVFGFAASMSSAFANDLPEGLDGFRLTGETESCVSTRRIDSTDVLDDDNILFEMNGHKTYLNRLNSSCPRLEFEGSFSYTISTTRLCRGDIITVLHNGDAGASCSLGEFELLEEVEDMDGSE